MTIALDEAADQPGDCWAALRASWEQLPEGERLTIEPGPSLRRRDALNLIRLAGFREVTERTTRGQGEIDVVKQPHSLAPLSCSVIVPCRNEAGNVDDLVRRVPQLGTHTQLLFVDGSSTDGTPQRIEALIRGNSNLDISLLHQTGSDGKAGAVFQGFDAATGDILMILDADMAVAPEDLPRFYLALAEGVADFANGTRFAYPMEEDAMRPLNNIGNRLFGAFFSWLLGSTISDTLCGTKAIFRKDWPKIKAARPLFGGHDPWGDFDLLLGAAYAGLHIIDVPVRYHARVAGESKMHAFSHGLVLARTCLSGLYRLKLQGSERTSGSA